MKLTIKQTNLKLSKEEWDFIYEELERLNKFVKHFGSAVEGWVEVGRTTRHHHQGRIFRAEVDIKIPGKVLRAESEEENLNSALVEVRKDLERQLEKYKDILESKKRRG